MNGKGDRSRVSDFQRFRENHDKAFGAKPSKCRHADEYKAIRPPTCGCDTCLAKWKASNLDR
jgi:hypothetical protein